VSLWKTIRKEWGNFVKYVNFEVGDGTKIKFWQDIWCGSCSLKEGYPDLFHIARDKEALVVDHMCFENGDVSWVLNFTQPVQDWELESKTSFLKLLYSSSAKGQGERIPFISPSRTLNYSHKSHTNGESIQQINRIGLILFHS
jgi:hypothetical protein